MIVHYVDAAGVYLGATDAPPPDAVAVAGPPPDARARWLFPGWGAAPATPPAGRWSKALLFDAMTDAEFAQFEAARAEFSPREIAVFDGAAALEEASPLWPLLRAAMELTYGAPRTAALLAAAAI